MATATKATAAKKTARTAKTAANDFAGLDSSATAETITNAVRDQFETISVAFAEQAETFRDQTEEMVKTMRGNFETVQSRAQTANSEFISAAREDMAEAVDFANELARAKTLADALEIQRDYWTNMFETRVERARAFTNASIEAAREAYEPVTKSYASAISATSSFDKFFPFAAK